MAYFIPGGYENGSVYNHGVAFKIAADCKLGKADLAYDTLKRICYDNPKNLNSGVEPYVVTNMYFGPQEKYRPGFSFYAWFTGAAGWVYRDVTEFILGVKGEYTVIAKSVYLWDGHPKQGGQKGVIVHQGDQLEEPELDGYVPITYNGSLKWINKKYVKEN